MRRLLYIILLLTWLPVAHAKLPDIVAVVNDQPITANDFKARKKMILSLSGIDEDDARMNMRLLDRNILNTLIEEELLNQYTAKNRHKISEKEIANGIRITEERNKIPEGQLIPYLQSRGISVESFKAQIKGELIKSDIAGALSRSVSISPKELDIAIINVAAKDFDVQAYLATAKENDDQHYTALQKLRKQLSCQNVNEKLYRNFASVQKYEGKISNLPSKTQTIVQEADLGVPSTPYTQDNQLQMARVCKREVIYLSNQDQARLTAFLSNKKMSQKAQKLFRDMKAKAYIKIYLPDAK